MNIKPHKCCECEQTMELAIIPDRQRTFYVGTRCGCSRPYSRETVSVSLVSAISAFDRVEL